MAKRTGSAIFPILAFPVEISVPPTLRADEAAGCGADLRAPTRERLMAKTSPVAFLREVRQELGRVTWPTRKETAVTTGMVFVMVTLLSLFFLGVDQIIAFGVQSILGLGR